MIILIILEGKYNKAKIFTENIEEKAMNQIIELCNQEFAKDSLIRIMPDVHSGAGCTIGTTMTVTDKVVPNLVGVDIGCGVYTCKLKEKDIDFKLLDSTIHENIPSGFNIRKQQHEYFTETKIEKLKCSNFVNKERAALSLGSLGSGNHFVELNKDKDGNLYLVIHSGSRYLGKQVAEHYQELAIKKLSINKKRKEIIKELKLQGRTQEIQNVLSDLKPKKIKKELAYLEGEHFHNYINDMKIIQEYAVLNRQAIAHEIIKTMGLTIKESFTTIHNYIDTENMILRKGSISARKNEKVLIPINMRDGSIIAIAKGNSDWNYSAPHGAGRLFSRGKSKELITLEQFKESMKGIYSTSVNESTIDESPMAYKSLNEIIKNIDDTVEIIDIIKPLYNFKA